MDTLSNGVLVTILDYSSSHGKIWVYVGNADNHVPLGWVFRDYLDCNRWSADQPIEGYAFRYNGEPSHTVSSLEECLLSCQGAENCSAYVFFKSRKLCRLMTRRDSVLERNPDAISGLNRNAAGTSTPSAQSRPSVPPISESVGPTIEIPLEKQGGTYVVPVLINNTITLDFVVDSGASDVSVPADVVMTLIRTGTIAKNDFIGTQTYTLADG